MPRLWVKILLGTIAFLALCMFAYDRFYNKTVDMRRAVDVTLRRQQLTKLYNSIMDAAEASGTRPFLIYGTLLGHFRNHDLICYDFDLDFGIMQNEYEALKKVLQNAFQHDKAYTVLTKEVFGYQALQIVHNDTLLSADITPFVAGNGWVKRNVPEWYSSWYLKECRTKYPKDWVLPLRQTTFLNRLTWVPNNATELLRCYYGDNFETPDHDCDTTCTVCVKK